MPEKNVCEYLEKMRQLLKLEKEEEYRQTAEYLRQTSLTDRIKTGFSWYPLQIIEQGYGLGNYPFLIIERTRNTDTEHPFQGGKKVRLFSAHYNDDEFLNGTVYYADRNRMKILFITDDLPDWIHDGKLGVDLLFDERTYVEMEKALDICIQARNNRTSDLLDMIFGHIALKRKTIPPLSNTMLNESQQVAVDNMLGAYDIALVHGPPGTGKTTTLVAATHALAITNRPLLVSAASNAATDHIALQMAHSGLRVVRIGNLSRIHAEILPYTLESLINNHAEKESWHSLKSRADQMCIMASKYKRNFGHDERAQRNLLYAEARDLAAEARKIEAFMIHDILEKADVIATTPVGAQSPELSKLSFHTLIMDEASQALLPATLILLLKVQKIVLAGDPCQLPPTVKTIQAQREGLSTTLMDLCMQYIPESTTMLTTQYRMHETIMAFPNAWFYQNRLKAHDTNRNHLIIANNECLSPLLFIDTAGCGLHESKHPASGSRYNEGEIQIIMQLLEEIFYADFKDKISPDVAVISPYREQVLRIQQNTILNYKDNNVTIDTIDAFQGQERDFIIISLVRSNNDGDIGFLQDYRRMNVALTRARKRLIVIGDSATIGADKFYASFLEFVEKHGEYRSAWEYTDF